MSPTTARPACAACRHYRPLNRDTGECRRRAPALPAAPAPGPAGRFGAFPLVLAGGWCGEHEPAAPRGNP